MKRFDNYTRFLPWILVLAGLPLMVLLLSTLPSRTLLKESLSLLTLLAFFQLLGLVFWSRVTGWAAMGMGIGQRIKIHKIIGYTCVTVMLFHPLFLVLPRCFEAGVAPGDAFITLVTTLKRGVVLGLVAWVLLAILGITSLIRKALPMTYRVWRLCHGLLSISFVCVAAWHAVDLGRHSQGALALMIIAMTGMGIFFHVQRTIVDLFKQ
ncbi:hypothetical protein DSLASN_09000 [Desulfoluna limicola]|uniref:Ferric oxidoreductase domain-containing protein n=1 Tax=Desulfoluna limicola TaxID=2810562 RepID=A0ABM7PCJ1_9BACT|nr:ferric reductase-like transmembrane domain-containing protein [Desulfoluna limicola]BCS95268.1 hypothetical protein DSLASN_09000 [Desulfoluna limicola]